MRVELRKQSLKLLPHLFFQISDDIICFCQLGGVAVLVKLLVVCTRRVVLTKPLEKSVNVLYL